MIKSLYIRLVAVFVAAVIVGLVVSLIVSNHLFDQQLQEWMKTDTEQSGEHIAALLKESDPGKWSTILPQLAEMKSSYIGLYDAAGGRVAGSADSPKVVSGDILRVIGGERYQQFIEPHNDGLPAWLMGFPIQLGGTSFALFVQPDYSVFSVGIRRTIQLNLLIVLVVGGAVMAVAARYLVKPLNMLTRATRKLAKGNFNVRLDYTRNDEIGVLTQSFNEMALELGQLEQMRQDFVSNVSHEIQSPLTSIIGFAKALRSSTIPEAERINYLDIIQSESERLSRLSDNLLKLASLESKHHPFRRTTFRLDEQLRHVAVVCEPLWSAKHIRLELTLPKTMIAGDADLLNQVWMNLLGNSIKFTPEGGSIRIRSESEVSRVKVSFADTGIGIPEGERNKIFQQFYKADRSRTGTTGGSGLGLAIVHNIVSLHKGAIQVESKEGEGTMMTVILPSIS
ncbi:Alkaline phosphatase synthesis sensor protein PhoR [Paenibacillus konkukensis]|uniref:Heme sensor protein HssS n=1 Tax=Paenibacillus konkukensis TaxID=2020716 RepID=A0ABY4RRH9_9BACL|nr:HAMP domain-containing sensor histidine kinase [Paenibacillus konkukensis]UQZ84103.1 Alkaline phosphatase synthesis sensor protein PhoR [Paenibacillus konkukensis]